MEGQYPLQIDGETVGALRVEKEGGWTVFDVRCRALPGLVRVSVYGEGREGYLGVLSPEADGLTLRRKLSRLALREFPARIERVGRAGEPCVRTEENAPQPQEAAAERERTTEQKTTPEEALPKEEGKSEPKKSELKTTTDEALPREEGKSELKKPELKKSGTENPSGKASEPEGTTDKALPREEGKSEPKKPELKTTTDEALPKEEGKPETEYYWYGSPDGALVCFDGRENLIALPAGDARIPAEGGGRPKTIEGREYLVFRLKDGQIVR